uniref:Uncharacterized protein n=1 Tax=viral metagenome TaxID=1070528 RepID=A0A6H1ZVD9_9ZZZZ
MADLDFSFLDGQVKGGETGGGSVIPEIVDEGAGSISIENQLTVERAKPDFLVIKREMDAMVSQARSIKVVDEESNLKANEMLIQLRVIARNIETAKTTNILYSTAARFKNEFDKWLRETFANPLKAMETAIKPKVNAYVNQQRELARRIAAKKAAEEAERLRKEQAKLQEQERQRQQKEREDALALKQKLDAEAQAAGVEAVNVEIPEVEEAPDVSHLLVVTPEIEKTPEKVKIDGAGTSSVKMVWNFRIIDQSKIPPEYCLPDEKKITAAIRIMNVREIPGIEIYEEADTNVRLSRKSSMSTGEF